MILALDVIASRMKVVKDKIVKVLQLEGRYFDVKELEAQTEKRTKELIKESNQNEHKKNDLVTEKEELCGQCKGKGIE
jgi:hypothetical protein